ncbi:hypothetical protein K474DRAFT_1711895 [Panus rudis PR-1116 ss-1]|nr:hypothetical protein K474DRAFT_1711895 [Panus rudis PR-1116 ss-1]
MDGKRFMQTDLLYFKRSQWTVVKVLYYLTRYLAPVVLIMVTAVHVQINAELWKYVFVSTTSPSAFPLHDLQMRAIHVDGGNWTGGAFPNCRHNLLSQGQCAISTQSSKWVFVMILLSMVLLVATGIKAWGAFSEIIFDKVIPPPLGLPWSGCVQDPNSVKSPLAAWIGESVNASVFFAMTMYRFVKLTEDVDYRLKFHNESVFYVFFYDGTVYFFLIFSIAVVELALFQIRRLEVYASHIIPWVHVVYSLAGSRLILNLRSAGDSNADWSLSGNKPSHTSSATTGVELSAIKFGRSIQDDTTYASSSQAQTFVSP